MDISVVVPLYNEEESLPELYAWIERVMKANGFSYEVIFVNDGSTDRSWQIIEELSRKSDTVHGIKFRRNYGKSPALYCGFEKAQGDVVITMDADLQDDINAIDEMVEKYYAGNDIVYGVIFAGVAGIMVFISFDELLPAAQEYGEHHLSLYGLISGMGVMAVSLLLFL